MTVVELHSLVRSISFVGGLKAWGATIELRRAPAADRLDLIVTYTVPDRDTGEPLTIHAVTALPEWRLLTMSPAQVIAIVHRDMLASFQHELNESILLAGQRLVDPHPEEKRRRGAA